MANSDFRLARVVLPLGDVLGRLVIERDPAVGQGDPEGEAANEGLSHRRRVMRLHRAVAVGVPLVNDAVVAKNQ